MVMEGLRPLVKKWWIIKANAGLMSDVVRGARAAKRAGEYKALGVEVLYAEHEEDYLSMCHLM